MADQAGGSASAVASTQHALSARRSIAAEADAVLSAALADAHRLTVDAVRQLDNIAADIESAVAQQHALALDTAEGAREFARFLLAKQREISAVVTGAVTLAEAKAAELQQLRDSYRTEV